MPVEASLSMMVSMYDSGRSGVECINRRGSLSSAAQECLFAARTSTLARIARDYGKLTEDNKALVRKVIEGLVKETPDKSSA
jgi:hypothetical protein